MTLEAKIGQMVQMDISYFLIDSTTQVNQTKLQNYILQYQIGSILNSPFSGGPVNGITGWNATQWRELQQMIQKYSNMTTYRIPILYGLDSIHGATYIKDAALFPQQINLAATFNPTLAYKAGRISAKDTRAGGVPWLFAPMLGLGLQPLWARFPESLGEDPYLASQMGKEIIQGMQEVTNDGGIPRQAAACMKHFIGYSYPTNGHDRAPVQLPDRILRQLYIPAFKAAVDIGVLTAMESYNEIGGVPMVSSNDYLTTLLRKQLNFNGFMVTDYAEIENLHNWHYVSATQEEAVALAMTDTTIDMSMVPSDTSFYDYLLSLVQSGVIPIERVNESVSRILAVKEILGLLDANTATITLDDPNIATVGQASDWEASLNTSRESIILAANIDNTLPLAKGKKVLLTGPTCNSTISQTGGWAIHWQGVYEESEQAHRATVLSSLTTLLPTGDLLYTPGPSLDATNLSAVDMTAVYALMDVSDVVVVCLGEGAYAEKPGDIDDLTLPSGQLDYVTQLAAYNSSKTIITIMIAGRPRLFGSVVDVSQAVLLAMQPGPLGGQAIAEVLTGAINPSGRLPFTYPHYSGDVLYTYQHKPSELCTQSNGPHSAAYVPCTVEFAFGSGYSYTQWVYSDFKVTPNQINESNNITVSLTVRNAGTMAGKHTVMLFLTDLYRRVTPEYKRLLRFQKVYLQANEDITLTWYIPASDLQYVGVESHYQLESGDFLLGASPYVDCRANVGNLAATTISALDTSSTTPMCALFNLTLTDSYQPICAEACNMWTASVNVSTSTSVSGSGATYYKASGQEQKWTWDYVDCITTYYKAPSCSNFDSVQCYDAFVMQTAHTDNIADNDDDDNDNDVSASYVVIFSVLSGVLGMMLGALVFYCLQYKMPLYKLRQPLLSDQQKTNNV
eukprot:gene6556-7232_t